MMKALPFILLLFTACAQTGGFDEACKMWGNCEAECDSIWGCEKKKDCGIWGCEEEKKDKSNCDFYGNCKE